MAIRPFGYNIENGKYVINPSETEAVRDYYEHIDSYMQSPTAFQSKWHDVIASYLEEVNEKDVDVAKLVANSLSANPHNEIIDKETWEKVQAIIKSRN